MWALHMGDEPVFSVRDAAVSFGATQALAGINLDIRAGERVALVGPSGAGKTTLLSLLNCTLTPTHGQVRVFGQELSALSRSARREVQARIGTVYQQLHLVGSLRVVHNVNAGRLGAWGLGKSALSLLRPKDLETVELALSRVGIAEKLHERTDRLSGGQQQRVALARVLVQDPAVILADEPISSLDRARALEVMGLLRDLTGGLAKTLVVSLHAYQYALSHCQRLVGLKAGRIVFDEPAGDVTETMVSDLYRIEAAAQR